MYSLHKLIKVPYVMVLMDSVNNLNSTVISDIIKKKKKNIERVERL